MVEDVEGQPQSLGDFFSLSPSAIEAIESAMAGQARDSIPEVLTLSNGVQLKLKPTPPFIFEEALAGMVPKPPMVQVEADPPRYEENPIDPDYLDAVDQYTKDQLKVVFRLAVMAGTELAEVPHGMSRPEEDEWADRLQIIMPDLDIPPAEKKAARYFAWLRWVALEKVEDIALVTGLPLLLAGISESEVANAMASFRSDAAR